MSVFEKKCHLSLENILEKFAFDVKLPNEVNDFFTNETTWSDDINNHRFITMKNMEEKDIKDGWMMPRKDICNLEELITIWKKINLTTTERVYDSINVSKSDTIYNCQNVYRSTDCRACKNIIFCQSCGSGEFLLASKRSGNCSFGIKINDSLDCSNSYNVICSNKVSNSLFIQDCFNLYECMFCAHIANKKYCIANMQFEEKEYYEIKKLIIDWILNS